MKHRVKGKKLNRDVQHRRALRKNLISALIVNGQIKTTQAKAKSVQPEIDKLVTKAKKGSVHDRRQIDEVLNRTKLVNRLVDELAPKFKRQSGFTRMVRLGSRKGDRAMMVKLEWIDAIVADDKKASGKNKPKAEVKKKSASEKKKDDSKKKTGDKPAKKKE